MLTKLRSLFTGPSTAAEPALEIPADMDPLDREIVETLDRVGVYVTSLDRFGIDTTPAMLASARELAADLSSRVSDKSGEKAFIMQATGPEIEAHPDILLWGLNERVLGIARAYLGRDVAYRGLDARRDLANGQKSATRLWHIDGEDRRIMKAVVYLNDVDINGGPFEYISKEHNPALRRLHAEKGGRLLDDDVRRAVPESEWKSCVGPAGTVLFGDTCTTFHRGRVPESADRLTLFYCYNTATPRHPELCQPLFSREAFLAGQGSLDASKRSALEYRY